MKLSLLQSSSADVSLPATNQIREERISGADPRFCPKCAIETGFSGECAIETGFSGEGTEGGLGIWSGLGAILSRPPAH